MTTYTDILKKATNHLASLYSNREISNIINIYLEDKFGLKDKSDLSKIPEKIIDEDIKKLATGMPIQYLVGKAFFYNSFFKVNKSVLIPRPETELLVYESLQSINSLTNPKVLDIGTGSGCIALSIGKECKNCKITGIDISSDAIDIAKTNKKLLKIENTTFIQLDFLQKNKWVHLDKYDLIISNPPYIKESEKDVMSSSTLEYEPKIALFPQSNDYLIFYKLIIEFAKKHLTIDGTVLCEINEFSANDLDILLSQKSLIWEIIMDLQDKPRILKMKF